MDRRTDDWVLSALGVVIFVALSVMVGALALGLSSSGSGSRPAVVQESPAKDAIVEQTDAPLPLGIQKATDAQIKGYVFNDVWRDLVDGKYLTVWAGSISDDRTRGVVLVWTVDRDHGVLPGSGFYRSPPGSGGLTIVDADEHVLSLIGTNSETFLFDADARLLSYANGDPVPTDTPTPSPEPEPSPKSTSPPIEFDTDTPTPTVSPAATATPTSLPPTTSSSG